MMRTQICRLLVAACLLSGMSRAAASAAPSGTPYVIDVISPMTGSGAFLGKDYKEAFAALEIAVNGSGGIAGHPVKFELSDSQTSGQVGLQLANSFIAQHAQVFIDGGPSTVCNSSVPIVQDTGPVDYCLSPVIRPKSGSYVFSSGMPSADQVKITLRFLKRRGLTKVGELSSTDSTGADLEKQVDTALTLPEFKGIDLVAREHFNPTDIGVSAQITHIKSAAPQAVLI